MTALAEGEVSRADREDLGRAILEESERLTALVEKVLDLSRLQAGVAEPRREWLSVEEILRETAAQLDPTGTRFSFSVDADLPLVRADGAQLERAFANLLENAARYSGAERVSVRARVVGGELKVRIVDRGPASRTTISHGSSRPSTAAPPDVTGTRDLAWGCDRQGLHRGQRRPRLGRIAPRAGHELRRGVPGRAAIPSEPPARRTP